VIQVPYGNTKQNLDGTFTCQHGEGECESDVIELCTLYKLSGNLNSIIDGTTSEVAFPFIQCMEINLGDPAKAESCFESTMGSTGLAWETVYECTQEEELDVQNAAKEATPQVQ
jgi:interferon, gamma-inducible protein 30